MTTVFYSLQVFLDLPSMLPAHSVFMLGLCLRISCYGDLLKENPSVTLVLLRLLLKAKIKGNDVVLHRMCEALYT